MIEIRFTDMPPSNNKLTLNVGKRRVKTPEYKAWKTPAEWEVRSQVKSMIKGAYVIDIFFRDQFKTKRKRDVFNYEKAISDALVSGGAIEDDSNTRRGTVNWLKGLDCAAVAFVSNVDITEADWWVATKYSENKLEMGMQAKG